MEGHLAQEVRTLLEDRRDKELAWQETEVPAAAIQERNELQAAQEKLGQIRVLETRLARRLAREQPPYYGVFEALVENRSPSWIESIHGQIRISSPDRPVPWEEGSFYCRGSISPGLEPGVKTWIEISRSDSGHSIWTCPPEGTDADTDVRIESAEAPESGPPFEVEFTIRDKDRLQALDEMISAQNWNE